MLDAEISFSYEKGPKVFDHFRFRVSSGEKLLVIAPPGSGKTTLAKLLTGALPSYSGGNSDGYARLDSMDILSMPAALRMERVGRVSQNTDEMLLFSSVMEEISFPLVNLGLDAEERERRISDSLSLFGLERYRDVCTSELSGGEKRRLMLAVLFAVDPDIYILDESFDELSPLWRERLAAIIRDLDRTVIAFGSHVLKEYDEAFSKVIALGRDGLVPCPSAVLPSPCIPERHGSSLLTVDDLMIERSHRSSGDLGTFRLIVPHFGIRSGECAVLLGENGSGKSTLSRVMCGLLEERKGQVILDGARLSCRERRHSVAYLMQNPYEELFLPTVLDELRSTGASADSIDKVLGLFHLDGNEYVQEMSYGRAKMLQAALFLLLERQFAIFDEMDSALPYDCFLAVLEAYLGKGTGVLVITHDTRIASAIPGRRMMIEEGCLHEC